MIRVVDASAVAAMLFGEPDAPWVHALLSGQLLLVPSIFHFELGNACRMKSKRYPDRAGVLLSAWVDWNVHPPITTMAIDLTTTMELARDHNLTFYDASYLWLVRDRASVLVSLDAQLVRAARRLGLHAPSPADSGHTTPRSRN